MEIKDFKARKLKLERDIAVATNQLINDFKDETGYNPNSIEIDMEKVVDIGGTINYVISSVYTEIRI